MTSDWFHIHKTECTDSSCSSSGERHDSKEMRSSGQAAVLTDSPHYSVVY